MHNLSTCPLAAITYLENQQLVLDYSNRWPTT